MRSATVDGALVREVRETLGLTQRELAAQVGASLGRPTDPSTISHLEANRYQPSARLFRAICEALDTPRESLLVKEEAA